jgi:Putative Flp pilus-assembly TadE/G-like
MRQSQTNQRGQALVLGLALLAFAAMGLVLVFNSSQATNTKQRLSNTADAAAFSAATYRARVLNYIAYSNRAIIANEVAAAQAVTLASWAQHVETTAKTVDDLASIFPFIKPYTSYVAEVAQYLSDWTDYLTTLELESRSAQTYGYKSLLSLSQELLETTVDVFAMNAVTFEVAKANDPRFFANVLNTSSIFGGFTKRYESLEERRRLAAVVKDEVALDPFTGSPRNVDFKLWGLPTFCLPGMSGNLPSGMQVLSKRGGTFLSNDLDRWEAADTLSHVSAAMRGFFPRCRQFEVYAFGFGGGESSYQGEVREIQHEYAGYHLRPNHTAAMSQVEDSDMRSYDVYSGIEKIRDLDYQTLAAGSGEGADRYPVLDVTAFARTGQSTIESADDIGAVAGRLRQPVALKGGHMGAMATAQVYFKRPVSAGADTELASLYNPYWQVRMRESTPVQRLLASAYMHLK